VIIRTGVKVLGFSGLFNFGFEMLVRRAVELDMIILLSVCPTQKMYYTEAYSLPCKTDHRNVKSFQK